MTQVAPAEPDVRRVIGDGGDLPDGVVAGLTETDLLAIYRSMVTLRTYDERSVVYHRQGRIGTYAIYWGHEAIQAGAVHALADEDWIFPSYRESAVGLLRGMPPETILAWWRGHPAGWWNPAEFRVASIAVPIASQVPHAVGLAWGKKLRGESACSLAFFGDGATSEGAFHGQRPWPTKHVATGCPACASTGATSWPSTRRPARRWSGLAPATARRSSRR